MNSIIETIKGLFDNPVGKGVGLSFLFSAGAAVVTKIRKKYTWLEFLNYWFVSFFIGILLFLILVYGFELNIYLVLGINNLASLFIYSILDEIDEVLKELNILLKEGLRDLISSVTDFIKSKTNKN